MAWQLEALPRPVPPAFHEGQIGTEVSKGLVPRDTWRHPPTPASPALPEIKTVFDVTGELMVSAKSLYLESPLQAEEEGEKRREQHLQGP